MFGFGDDRILQAAVMIGGNSESWGLKNTNLHTSSAYILCLPSTGIGRGVSCEIVEVLPGLRLETCLTDNA